MRSPQCKGHQTGLLWLKTTSLNSGAMTGFGGRHIQEHSALARKAVGVSLNVMFCCRCAVVVFFSFPGCVVGVANVGCRLPHLHIIKMNHLGEPSMDQPSRGRGR